MNIRIPGIYLLPFAAGCTSVAPHVATSRPVVPHEPTYFAVVLSPGPAWDYSRSRDEQIGIMEHRKYMGSLASDSMVMGGPFEDALGGLAVLRAGSVEEARRIIDQDPGVRTGLMKADIHRWRVAKIDTQRASGMK